MKKRKSVLAVLVVTVFLAFMTGCTSENEMGGTAGVIGNDIEQNAANYCINNGLEVLPNGTCECDGVIYDIIDPGQRYKTKPATISFGTITETEAGENVTVYVPVTITLEGEYTEDNVCYMDAITPSIEIADRYSGLILPCRVLSGEDAYSYNAAIQGDENLNVAYSCVVNTDNTDWVKKDTGYTCGIIFNATYTLTIPSQYDGIIFKITPTTVYTEEDEEFSEGEVLSKCIVDEYPDGTVLMEIR